jgi:N-acetylmuramoyl-L-alanine amidase
MRPPIVRDLLPYNDRLELRRLEEVDLVVVHCTELPDLAEARRYGERILYSESGTGNSGHYYIDRDGACHQWVADERVAHHVRQHNERSIGVELVNRGRYPDWLHSGRQRPDEAYPEAQIEALVGLIAHLSEALPGLAAIAGHADLDRAEVPASDDPGRRVRRKVDPGPLFPWTALAARIGLKREAAEC